MVAYILKRLLLSIPTLLGISIVCFTLIQFVPGGPIDRVMAEWQQGGTGGEVSGGNSLQVTEEQIQSMKEYYGFDKPVVIRYFTWLWKLVRFDFGESYHYEEPVWDLIQSRFPVSITFGLVSFFATYIVCIPLGIIKAVKHNSWFDSFSSALVFFLYSIPPFAFGILLIVLFCGGSLWNVFPMEGFTSEDFEELGIFGKIADVAHHMFLPLLCYIIGSFAMLTILMKNSLLEQLKQDYVTTARAKGLRNKVVILRHATRNALLPIANGFGQWIGIFFSGSLLLETIFGLDGVGLLSYEAILNRDFPVVLANIMLVSVAYIFGNLISDLLYVVIDPRIDFS